MALNLPRVRRLVRRVLQGRAVPLEALCERQWTVCPASETMLRPALYPPGALERIAQLSPYRNQAGEDRMVHGGRYPLRATLARTLRHVDVVEGHLYCKGSEWAVGVGEAPLWLPPRASEPPIAQANMVSTSSGTLFFGCLLLDDFPLELLAEDPRQNVSLPSKPSGHEAGYRELLGLVPKVTLHRAHIAHMTWFSDPPFNDSKAARYRTLRRELRQRITEPGGTGRVYLRRGLAGQRRVMANEAELEAVLTAHGFTVIDPMACTAAEIARLSLEARLVVSIEGSQISHAQFSMADRAALLVIQPPDRFCMQYKEFTDALDMRFGFVVGRPGAEGFTVDIGELLRLVDQLEAALA